MAEEKHVAQSQRKKKKKIRAREISSLLNEKGNDKRTVLKMRNARKLVRHLAEKKKAEERIKKNKKIRKGLHGVMV